MMQREAKISNYFLAAYCVVCLLLLSLPLSGPVRALKAGVVYLVDPGIFAGESAQERVAQLPGRIRDLITADQENQTLRAQAQESLWLEDNLRQLNLENQRLRALLGLKAPRGWTPLWARVMARDPLNRYHSFLVDAGRDDGVAVDDPVLGPSPKGLAIVGRVVEVRSRASTVLLLTDELSAVAADISSGTVEGLVQGQGNGGLLLNYLPPGAKPREGETVYTSPTSAVFPGNLPVGTVIAIRPEDPFLAVKSAEVRPEVSAGALADVAVLIRGAAHPAQSGAAR
ncbi:MAG: rod shape-determining protein MreC [Elusimicrobia bacterium]|nr:rod shape-determining protein MreC [Elusimicrobiota bacterium]MDE2314222.1 rod shape-determining protein MreC [Elusimicrobiota bacterium]